MQYPIITISREHGSGGRLIAKQVAEALGIPLYDKKLIQMIASESGLSEEYVAKADKIQTSSFLYNLYFDSQNLPLQDQVYLTEAKIIRDIAEKGPCVIVGRCADYILKNHANCLHVFIYAPMEEKVNRASSVYLEKHSHMESYLEKYDKQRATYYAHVTNEKWGYPQNYHVMFNSTIGLDQVSEEIIRMAKKEAQ
ncbi:MAG: AAA family ATPase [Massiliimalia sp.]|jgi:cytidylate kinase